MPRPFNSDLIIEEIITDTSIKAYHVGFDQNRFRLQPLVDIISDVIPEFALGYHGDEKIQMTEIRRRLRESALRLYTTDKYSKRGEFGEIILHLLLRDFCNSFPLLSKINFKDSTNSTVKGFDAIHIVINGASKKLWLGESKLYTDGIAGVKALAEDLKNHIKEDYLRKEFMLIANKVPSNFEGRDYWLSLIHENNTLDKIFDGICIPMVCTYSSEIFKSHTDNTKEYFEEFTKECANLQKIFESSKISTKVEVILMLLPVPCKTELADKLNERLNHMQNI